MKKMESISLKYDMSKNTKTTKGITLIALVITIIVLLILAGITISLTIGESGIFNQAKRADEEMKIAEYKEFIDLAQTQVGMDDYNHEISILQRLEKIKEILENDTNFDGSTFQIKQYEEKDSLVIITKEGYVFVVTETECRYIGKNEITNLPDIKVGDIIFAYTPQEYTSGNVEVSIKIANEEYKGYKIEYSYNLTDWSLYKDIPIVVTENDTTIYARITNEIVSSEKYGQITIINIDREEPTVNINFTAGTLSGSDFIVTATITQEDTKSGIDFSKTKWVYNTSSDHIEDINEYTGGILENNEQSINLVTSTAGTYYLHILATDKAGNQKTIVSNPINITVSYHTHTSACKHVHTGTTTSGGGCYGKKNVVYHTHSSSCYSYVECSGTMVQSHVDSSGNTHLTCNSCGRSTTNVVPGSKCGATVQQQTCGKSTNTVEKTYYSLNCGKDTTSDYCGKTTSTIDSYNITY